MSKTYVGLKDGEKDMAVEMKNTDKRNMEKKNAEKRNKQLFKKSGFL